MMNKEQLSQLLDDELNEQEMNAALDALLADPQAQKTWQAMHMVRGAVTDDAIHASFSLSQRISASIEAEPTIMAPTNLPARRTARSIPSEGRNTASTNRIARLRVPLGLAVAASLVAVLVINLSPSVQDESRLVAEQSPEQSGLLLPQASDAQLAMNRELQSMVVQHGEFSGAVALNGLVAYAKVVNGSTSSRR